MNLTRAIEGLLFAADTPMSLDRLCELLSEYERGDVREALAELVAWHDEREGGFHLVNVAGGWQFRTHAVLQPYLVRGVRIKPGKLSPSALETLAIVAYRQPVTRAEIEYLRGVDCGGVLRTLLEKRLARILGKKDIPGRPLIYGTSREFLEMFGLRDLRSLPTLKEIQALDDIPHVERQEELELELGEEGGAAAPVQISMDMTD